LQLKIIRQSRDLTPFLRLPWRIYQGDRNWVPPLLSDQRKLLDPKRHPFFDHGEMTRLIALRDGVPVGRICAIDNRAHVDYWQEPVGFFGFFECENNKDTAKALFDAAANWLQPRGLNFMRGPMNPSTNETCALLIEGFDSPPVVMMPYNPPYYIELLESVGLAKIKDLYAYKITKEGIPERVIKAGEEIKSRNQNITVRPINLKNLTADLEKVRTIYNAAWSKNWGFVPMTAAEFDHTAADLKKIIDPELAFIAEDGDAPVGFSLALPDVNVALRHINGRLFPFGIFKVLYYSRKIKNARIITMGVVKEYRGRGIDVLFYLESFRRGVARGYEWGETSWILEDNVPMNRALEMIGAKIYKRYRIYQMAI
ncbi:MAG: N-acetyltransferase, partial [bacterium]